MASTHIRVSTIAIDGVSRLQFSVDGNEEDPQVLTVAPDRKPLSDFMTMVTNPAVVTNVVTAAGDALTNDLMKHANTQFQLTNTVNNADPPRRINIEIQKRASAAHNYPWEVLHVGPRFVATNPGIAIVRIVPVVEALRRDAAPFDGTLRILAIIAAAGVDGVTEWNALQGALPRWAGGLNCRVLVHDPALKKTIDDANDPRIQCDMVPLDGFELIEILDTFAPHICHIFCHGRADQSPRLEIANNTTNFGGPPHFLSAAELASHLKATWLVTLNACSSGAAGSDANVSSVASELVELGVPVVIAMRQIVPVDVANCFTSSFFGNALRKLDKEIRQPGSYPLDLHEALADARRAIVGCKGGFEDRSKEWTFPIICTTSRDLEIHVHSAEAKLSEQEVAEIEGQMAAYRSALELDAWSDDQRAQINRKLAELQRKIDGALAASKPPGS
jgi:hypothetical protein